MKLSLERIKQEIHDKYGNEYEVIDERTIKTAKAQRREIQIVHSKCAHSYWLQLNRVIDNMQPCPYCNPKKSKMDQRIFEQKVHDLSNGEYTVIGKYINNYTKIEIKHNKCGRVLEMLPKHFINDGYRCKSCAMKARYNKNFETDLGIMSDGTLHIDGEYSGAHNSISIKCDECGGTFMTTPSYLYKQYRKYSECHCPLCSHCASIGEKMIMNILDKHGIRYDYNKSIDGCRRVHALRFDFIIETPGDHPLCIEFDGVQHYERKDFYDESEMELIRERDAIKNAFCLNNGIPLLRLRSYSKLKLEKSIIEFLKTNNFNVN